MQRVHLFYVDKNWIHRGYMQNYNLIVDYAKKQFKTYTNPFYWYTWRDDLEVKKKSDIIDYEVLLEKTWFARVDDF